MKRWVLMGLLVVMAGALNAQAAWAEWNKGASGSSCLIMDAAPPPLYELDLAYLPTSQIEGAGRSAVIEAGFFCDGPYWRDILGGDLALHTQIRSTLFLESADLHLPEQVARLSLNMLWSGKFSSGWGMRVGFQPGIYSDLQRLEGDMFFFPFSVAGVKRLNASLSGLLGLAMRPGFEREIMPMLGVAWSISPEFRVDLFLPESRILWTPTESFRLLLGFDWNNTSYHIKKKDRFQRELLTMDDFRVFVGTHIRCNDEYGVRIEAGRAFHRSLEFSYRNGTSDERAVNYVNYGRIGLVGYF